MALGLGAKIDTRKKKSASGNVTAVPEGLGFTPASVADMRLITPIADWGARWSGSGHQRKHKLRIKRANGGKLPKRYR